MASRIMHLAVAKIMENCNVINNNARYEIGQVLPDAITPGVATHAVSHFVVTLGDGKRKVIDFAAFHTRFENEMLSDDLYLGYYLHLIQDGIYRRFLYDDYGFPDDVAVLHNDYRLLNTYLVSKYHLEKELIIPNGFQREKINRVYPFLLDQFLDDIKNDFLPYKSGKTSFFTETIADEYITKCSELCYRELKSLKAGRTSVNPMDYAWELPAKR